MYKIGQIPEDAKSPMPGVRIWRNRINKGFVFRLHYTADPRKRTEEWRESAMAGMSKRDWQREYEINFTVPAGEAVYEHDFEYDWHVARTPIKYVPSAPLILGWDIGSSLSPACVITQFLGRSTLNVLREIWQMRVGIERFAEEVLTLIRTDFGNARVISFSDPDGWTPQSTDERSAIDVLNSLGFRDVRPGAKGTFERIRAISMWLQRAIRGRPALNIDPRCYHLIMAFQGGYHYPEIEPGKQFTKSKEKPTKNEYAHIIEALQYCVTGMQEIISTYTDKRAMDVYDFDSEPKAKSAWAY